MDQSDDLDAIWTTNARLRVINARFPFRLMPGVSFPSQSMPSVSSPFSIVYLLSCIHIAMYGSKSRRLTWLLGSKCDLNDLDYLQKIMHLCAASFSPKINAPEIRLLPEYLDLITEYVHFGRRKGYPKLLLEVETIWFASWKGCDGKDGPIITPLTKKMPAFSRAVVEGYYYQNPICAMIELDTEQMHYRVGFLLPHPTPNSTPKKPQYYMGDKPVPTFSDLIEMQNNVAPAVIDLNLPIFPDRGYAIKTLWSPSVWGIRGTNRLYRAGSEPIISMDPVSLDQVIDYSIISWRPLPTNTTTALPEHTVSIDHTFLCYIRSIPDDLLLYLAVISPSEMR